MDKTTLEELKSHPAVIEIQRKHEAETLEQRRQWAGELEQAQVAKMKNLPPLKQTLDEKQAAVDAAKATLKQAEAEASQAAAALEREAQRLNGVISGLDGQLRETAPAAIDQAIEFFRDKFYELRRPGNIERRAAPGKFSLIKMRWLPGEKETNAPAITRAMRYCSEAIEKLEKLKLEPQPSPADIEKIGAAMPGIDSFEVYDDPNPFEGVKNKFLPPRIPDRTEQLLRRG